MLRPKIGKPIEPRKFGYDVMSVRPYAHTHRLGLGTSLPLSLIWSPSYAKSDIKTYSVLFGSFRVDLPVGPLHYFTGLK